jgi:hypothetical protein
MSSAVITDVFTQTVKPLMKAAKETGATSDALSAAFLAAMEGIYGSVATKHAAAQVGFRQLLGAEGGAVNAKEAAALYGGHTPSSDEAVRKAARLGQIVAVRDGRGNMLFPKWQFSEKGGVLPGMRETLKVLRQHAHFDDLLPITFFLNPSARLDGKRPLDLLRSGRADAIDTVNALAAEAAE